MLTKMYSKFLESRVIRQAVVTLSHRQVYVFPTKNGFFALLFFVVLIIMAINFQNTLVYVFVFWLMGMWCISIILTWYNLIGLRLTTERTDNVFVGDYAAFSIIAEGLSKNHLNISFSFKDSKDVIDCPKGERRKAVLSLLAEKRGVLELPRIKIETTYPLGFIRAWSYVELDQKILCYPKPWVTKSREMRNFAAKEGDNEIFESHFYSKGVDDFVGLAEYQMGDSLRLLNWKAYAKGQGLLINQFSDSSKPELWFNYHDFIDDKEGVLSKLCYLVIQATKNEIPFGLDLLGTKIDPGIGTEHLRKCLMLLARY